jgi:hypothetical protein
MNFAEVSGRACKCKVGKTRLDAGARQARIVFVITAASARESRWVPF